MNRRILPIGSLLLALSVPMAHAQEPDSQSNYVSRQEYEHLKSQFEALKAQVQTFKASGELAQETRARLDLAARQRAASLRQLQAQIEAVHELAEHSSAGSSKFLITGYGTAGYSDSEETHSTFSASLNPLFLWKLGERILFETELELSLSSGGGGHGEEMAEQEAQTNVELEYAHASYLLNDYITLGAGKFLTPFGLFNERLHPTWINKLPDPPLPYRHHQGIAPMASLGAYVRGGAANQLAKFNYAFYLSNGPALVTGGDDAGTLDFNNFTDINNNKALGGRVGLLPIPEVEIGGSFQVARVNPSGFESVDALLLGVDLSFSRYVDSLGGIIDLRTEWVWSDVEEVSFPVAGHHGEEEEEDPGEDHGMEMLSFDNKRFGGYLQLAYRPSGSANQFIKNLEGVVRWDILDQPEGSPGGFDEQRWTFGLNYWFDPSSVVKFAYQLNEVDHGKEADTFLLQLALGF